MIRRYLHLQVLLGNQRNAHIFVVEVTFVVCLCCCCCFMCDIRKIDFSEVKKKEGLAAILKWKTDKQKDSYKIQFFIQKVIFNPKKASIRM